MKPIRVLLLFAQDNSWATLSYAASLPGAIARCADFEVSAINLARRSLLDDLSIALKVGFRRLDAIFVMHSVFSNASYMSERLADRIARLRCPVVYFVGNEYKSMPEKMALAERLGSALLVSQIASLDVLRLYADRLKCRALFVPNAVADPAAFPPGPPLTERRIDIGYRAFDGVKYLGHEDRRRIAELVEPAAVAKGLVCDISLDPTRRLGGADWIHFLHGSKFQLGVEAGTDYFELDDHSRLKGNALEAARPDIGFDEYWRIVFGDYPARVSGRTITSRHLECATTRTPMIMFPGDYCGVFEAGRHYVGLARDGSDLNAVFDQLRNASHCAAIAAAAESVAIENFGAAPLMAKLANAVREIAV